MLGVHIILELHGVDSNLLNDAKRLEEILVNAAIESGSTIIGKVFHKFSPHGVTGIIGIKESHISIHTWPEFGYAALDVFTCRGIDPNEIVRIIVEAFKPKFYTTMVLSRGEPYVEDMDESKIPKFPKMTGKITIQ